MFEDDEPWFMAGDNDGAGIQVQAGVSSNLNTTDLDDAAASAASAPTAPRPESMPRRNDPLDDLFGNDPTPPADVDIPGPPEDPPVAPQPHFSDGLAGVFNAPTDPAAPAPGPVSPLGDYLEAPRDVPTHAGDYAPVDSVPSDVSRPTAPQPTVAEDPFDPGTGYLIDEPVDDHVGAKHLDPSGPTVESPGAEGEPPEAAGSMDRLTLLDTGLFGGTPQAPLYPEADPATTQPAANHFKGKHSITPADDADDWEFSEPAAQGDSTPAPMAPLPAAPGEPPPAAESEQLPYDISGLFDGPTTGPLPEQGQDGWESAPPRTDTSPLLGEAPMPLGEPPAWGTAPSPEPPQEPLAADPEPLSEAPSEGLERTLAASFRNLVAQGSVSAHGTPPPEAVETPPSPDTSPEAAESPQENVSDRVEPRRPRRPPRRPPGF